MSSLLLRHEPDKVRDTYSSSNTPLISAFFVESPEGPKGDVFKDEGYLKDLGGVGRLDLGSNWRQSVDLVRKYAQNAHLRVRTESVFQVKEVPRARRFLYFYLKIENWKVWGLLSHFYYPTFFQNILDSGEKFESEAKKYMRVLTYREFAKLQLKGDECAMELDEGTRCSIINAIFDRKPVVIAHSNILVSCRIAIEIPEIVKDCDESCHVVEDLRDLPILFGDFGSADNDKYIGVTIAREKPPRKALLVCDEGGKVCAKGEVNKRTIKEMVENWFNYEPEPDNYNDDEAPVQKDGGPTEPVTLFGTFAVDLAKKKKLDFVPVPQLTEEKKKFIQKLKDKFNIPADPPVGIQYIPENGLAVVYARHPTLAVGYVVRRVDAEKVKNDLSRRSEPCSKKGIEAVGEQGWMHVQAVGPAEQTPPRLLCTFLYENKGWLGRVSWKLGKIIVRDSEMMSFESQIKQYFEEHAKVPDAHKEGKSRLPLDGRWLLWEQDCGPLDLVWTEQNDFLYGCLGTAGMDYMTGLQEFVKSNVQGKLKADQIEQILKQYIKDH